MPKKTKKEKIIAQYRRKLQSVRGRISVSHEPSLPALPPVEFQPERSQPLSKPREDLSLPHLSTTEFAAIRRDLTKTIVLAAVAITIELGLFWRLQT